MCTLSIVQSSDGAALRLLMNRDERRLRPVARPPAVHDTAAGEAVWPGDPVSGGTWIAATSTGMALAVLNIDGHRTAPGVLSRGLVVPMLADCHSLARLVERWHDLDTSVFAPFRLVAITRDAIAVCATFDRDPSVIRTSRAHLFASSALGDAEVEPLRRDLFARLLGTEADSWRAQTRLHQHAWPDRRHLSVMMSRVEACTVSQTEIVLRPDAISLAYRPVVDGWPMPETRRVIAPVAVPSRAA